MSEPIQDQKAKLEELYRQASALFNSGRKGEAEKLFREILKIAPEDPEAHNCLAMALEVKGQYEQAIRHYRMAFLYGEGHPERHLIMLNLAIRLREAGNPHEAITFLQKAVELKPDEARIYSVMGNVMRDTGNIEESHRLFLKASELDPQLQSNWNYLGSVSEAKQDFEKARGYFEKALELDEKDAATRSNLVDILEKLGRVEEAEEILSAAPADVKDAPVLQLSAARLKARRKDYKGAAAMLEAYDDEASHAHRMQAHIRHYELARYLDKLGDYDRAFEHMRIGNEMRKLSPGARNLNPDALVNEVIAHRDVFAKDWVEKWTPPVPYEKGRAPVFLVGFPRSGTTLLDVILAAHPKVKVLEERPTTHLLGAAVMEKSGGTLGGVMHFTAEQIRELQAFYFAQTAQFTALGEGELLVDKMPMATRYIDLFYRVFPNAKFIMALRHPCDVLLSCYQQNFVPNKVTLPLMELKSAARLYAETMALFEQFRDILPLDLHVIRYEDLVENLEGEARKLVDFLGLEWNDNLLKHHESEAAHVVTSASYAQVTEAVHSRSSGRWVNYRKYLEPVFPLIKPAATRFGYTLD